MKIKLGQKTPDFSLPDQHGKIHKLSDYECEWVLLYFYPKDDTPGCTKEACDIRDEFPKFQKLNAKVLGVSTDSVASHEKFAKKYKLPFTLLADDNKEVVKLYGIWSKKKFMGRTYMGTMRTSFLINPDGKIEKIYEKVEPAVHVKEILEDLKNATEK